MAIEDFKLQFNIEHDFPKGSFNQKYVDHYCNGDKLRDMDEFTTSRQHYKEFGRFTNATPNKHPKSPWMKFWNEEKRRGIEGYNIGRDWIPGYAYFYFNYGPINKSIQEEEKGVRSKKIWEFPDLWDSDYYYYHYIEECEKRGKFAAVIKSRRKGYSYKGSNMCNRNFFLIPKSNSFVYANSLQYLTGDGILTKAWELMAWINENTAWSKKCQYKNTDLVKKASFKKPLANGALIEAGYMSTIQGVTLNGDIDKIRGKAAKLIIWEEFGNNIVGKEGWIVTSESMKQDDEVFGLQLLQGTGGSEGNDFAAMSEMVDNPEGFDILPVPDIFGGDIRVNKAFFVPCILNRKGAYDKDGNSDLVKAVEAENTKREVIKKVNSSDDYARKLAERPFTIDEAILKMEYSPFDILLIRAALAELKTSLKSGVDSSENGKFTIGSNGKPRWNMDMSMKYIDTFPTPNDKKEGCWKIIEHPHRNENGEIDSWRYASNCDPVDKGHDEAISDNKHSLASTFIIDCITRNIVAEYTGRPAEVEDYYEQLMYGIEYYNAELLYENNMKGLYGYFRNANKLSMLAFEPMCLKDRVGYKFNGKVKGYHATAEINAWGRQLLNTWSKELVVISQDEVTGEVKQIPRMYLIKSVPLLQEMEAYTSKGNYDRISASGGLMILLNDRQLYIEGKKEEKKDNKLEGLSKMMKSIIRIPRKFSTDIVVR